MKYKDEYLIGKNFGKLTIKSILRENGKRYCCCKCNCGEEKNIEVGSLTSKKTISCGCHLRKKATTHGLSNHQLYNILNSMKQRCYNQNNKYYKYYKYYRFRAIKINQDWLNDPEKFIKYGIDNGWKKGLSIDRIDVNGDYCPENCRWVDMHVQNVNQRVNKNNVSGYKGVIYFKRDNSWESSITVNKKRIYLGRFKSKRKALDVRNKYIIDNGLNEYKIQEWKGEINEKNYRNS